LEPERPHLSEDPWTDPDPQPGDFDAYLEDIDPSCVEVHEGNPGAKVTIVDQETAEKLLRGA